jgi:outer membrane protein OmpA-like peptidoglycan-associated protein
MSAMRRRIGLAGLGGLVLAAAGCSTVAPAPPTAPPPADADTRAGLPAALNTERQWLQSWFRGTPVLIEQRGDGVLVVEVPREFCFDAGHSRVKPALAAVLDKVAESLHRVPATRLITLAAPGDAGGTAPLALQRAAQVQRHLRERGVASARLAAPTASPAAAVQLRIGAALP